MESRGPTRSATDLDLLSRVPQVRGPPVQIDLLGDLSRPVPEEFRDLFDRHTLVQENRSVFVRGAPCGPCREPRCVPRTTSQHRPAWDASAFCRLQSACRRSFRVFLGLESDMKIRGFKGEFCGLGEPFKSEEGLFIDRNEKGRPRWPTSRRRRRFPRRRPARLRAERLEIRQETRIAREALGAEPSYPCVPRQPPAWIPA